jgi:hypothetical protein
MRSGVLLSSQFVCDGFGRRREPEVAITNDYDCQRHQEKSQSDNHGSALPLLMFRWFGRGKNRTFFDC